MSNELIKVKCPKGTRYFTNAQRAANWLGVAPSQMKHYIAGGNSRSKNVAVEVIDGSEVKWKDID